MYHHYSTQVPNELFDHQLPYLNQAELKVLLVIIRQTLGWIDPKTKKRKRKDWISIKFFSKRTGLTHKSISIAIATLIQKDLIMALDYRENLLKTTQQRRGKKRIYYTYANYFRSLKKKTMVDMLLKVFTYPPNTKQTHTKEYKQHFHKKTDAHRYKEIIEQQQRNSNIQ